MYNSRFRWVCVMISGRPLYNIKDFGFSSRTSVTIPQHPVIACEMVYSQLPKAEHGVFFFQISH